MGKWCNFGCGKDKKFSMHLGVPASMLICPCGQVVQSYLPSLESISVSQEGCKYLVVNSTHI